MACQACRHEKCRAGIIAYESCSATMAAYAKLKDAGRFELMARSNRRRAEQNSYAIIPVTFGDSKADADRV